ncbi:MAG: 30S ribosomal protein S24e [Promethearchaeota archaeon]
MSFDIEIIEKKKNPLINRLEVKFKTNHFGQGTPNRLEIKKKIAALLQTNEKLTLVRKIKTHFGSAYSIGTIHAYEDPEELQFYEPFHVQVRNIPQEKREELYKLKKKRSSYKELFDYQ